MMLSLAHLWHIDNDTEKLVDLGKSGQMKEGGLIQEAPLYLPSLLSSLSDLGISCLGPTLPPVPNVRIDVILQHMNDSLEAFPKVPEDETFWIRKPVAEK